MQLLQIIDLQLKRQRNEWNTIENPETLKYV
jgi:hypothetical protein